MDALIEKIEVKLEHILESDPRTIKNPECECGSIYDSVYEVLKMVRELEVSVGNNTNEYISINQCPVCGRKFTDNMVCACGANNASIRL